MKRIYITAIILLALLAGSLTACGETHWDGSPYTDRPVYGSGAEQGVSQRLHNDAQKCGLEDKTIDLAMGQILAEENITSVNAIHDMEGHAADVTLTSLGEGIVELQLTCK
jgi:hypothetical protein